MSTATAPLVGMGAMRLSTERDRDEGHAVSVLHAAFDAGITFIDTADAYCWNAEDFGHNERLVGRALATWTGDRSRIVVGTKGGLTRPRGQWIADGRARHLAAACEASQRALGVDRLQLYQLHAPDPRTPFATSVRALASLKRDGLVEQIGLCNVQIGQIEAARAITDIATVQVEMSVWHDASFFDGVAEYCIANGIRLLAHRPLGGLQRKRKTMSDPLLTAIAREHHATPCEVALAWLIGLSDLVIPLPGATRIETVRSIARVRDLVLTAEDRARLEERFTGARRLREGPRQCATARQSDGEVVLIMGLPGAGKTEVAEAMAAQGYARLNRDEVGGSLSGLLPALERLVASGASRIVLDNTYVSRKARAAVLETAWTCKLPVRCVWLSTTVEDAQVNAASRLVSRYGRLLGPEELVKAAKRDVAAFGPNVQFRYQRELEPPDAAEGFSRIDVMPFARQRDVRHVNRAILLWCDGVLRRSRSGSRTPASADDVEVFPGRAEMLQRYEAEGWRLLGLSWQPEIADETLGPRQVEDAFTRMRELLGVAIEVEYCPHAAGPPKCWCRKPLPGLGVVLIYRHHLDPSQCIYVGNGPQDPGFARRLGFQYQDANDFFAPPKN